MSYADIDDGYLVPFDTTFFIFPKIIDWFHWCNQDKIERGLVIFSGKGLNGILIILCYKSYIHGGKNKTFFTRNYI